MRSYIRSGVGLGVLLGLAIAVGCSSSDDSGSGGGGGGSGGASAGSAGKGGSGGSGTAGKGGSGNNAGAGVGEGGAGESGGDNGGTEGGAGGESGGFGGPIDTAGAAGADTGPKACNDLSFTGAQISETHSSATAPTFTFGTFKAGNYRLTSATYYDGNTGGGQYGEIARVAVTGQSVKIDLADKDSFGTGSSEFTIVMANPSTNAPTSVIITCSTLAQLQSIVGQESKSLLQYTATNTSFTLYEIPLKLALTYTLEP